jgi:hypothetical protein
MASAASRIPALSDVDHSSVPVPSSRGEATTARTLPSRVETKT